MESTADSHLQKGYNYQQNLSPEPLNKFSQVEDTSYFCSNRNLQQGFVENCPVNHLDALENNQNLDNMNSAFPTVSQKYSYGTRNDMPVVDFSIPTYPACNSQLHMPSSDCRQVHQPFLQVNNNFHYGSHCNQIIDKDMFNLPQSKHDFIGFSKAYSETSVLDLGQANAAKPAYSASLDFQNVLLSYITYKSRLGNLVNNQVHFLKHIHTTKCRSKCNCYQYSVLVTHFDNCLDTNCSICVPVLSIFATGKVYMESKKRKTYDLGAYCNREANGTCGDAIVDYLPPLKCHKQENPIFDMVAPAMNQPCTLGRDLSQDLNSTLGTLMSTSKYGDIVSSYYYSRTIYETIDLCERLIMHDGYERLMMHDDVPDDPEVSTTGHEEGDIQIMYLDLYNIEEKCEIPASIANPKMEMKLKHSWADYSSLEEMKEHLNSFGWTGQEIGQNMKHAYGEKLCQLCGKSTLEFAQPQLYCSSCGILIKPNVLFYKSLPETGMQDCFCSLCYKSGKKGSNSITFNGGYILKNKLQKVKNDEKTEEPWIRCNTCKHRQHQVCALYNDKSDPSEPDYTCPKCRVTEIETGCREPLLKSVGLGAKNLPKTMLSDHIEKRLFKRLKEEREQQATDSRKELNEYQIPGEVDLAVRLVLSVDKKLEVKPQYLDIVKGSDYPTEFLYRSKVILLFQRIEGVDVCLFAMYVQEYGSKCGKPNQRCIYISYIDSVKYLRPEAKTTSGEALRTLVYHEILIGYLDYCKRRGFSTCYIWACPPMKGEDFILYCHPEYQRTPNADKLQRWYGSMLKKAIKENIVVDHTNIYDYFFHHSGECNTKITLSRLPYFDGDYWSSSAKSIIRDSKQEFQKKIKKPMTKRTLKGMGHITLSTDALVMEKLGHAILPAKKNFFVVHLQFFCKCCHEAILSGVRWSCDKCRNFHICLRCIHSEQTLNKEKTHTSKNGENHVLCQVVMDYDLAHDTEDQDIGLNNDLFNNRHAFLSFCQSNHYQFDTLRYAKYSSLMILYHLHKSFNPVVDIYTER